MENSAGMGNHIGSKFDELGEIIREVGSPRVKICLDTQHSFAAGYNLTTDSEVAEVMKNFDKEIGLDHLVTVHCNDSKIPLSGGVDRHENLGEGKMGLSAFQAIMNNSAFKHLPFYLEVPGFQGKGPDKENLDILKSIRQDLGILA